MGVIDNAVTRALEIAADDSHGYDQTSRWGSDYDCSSLVIDCFKRAGLPLSCTYTGNMRWDMLRHGFGDVTGSVDLTIGAGHGVHLWALLQRPRGRKNLSLRTHR